MGYRQSRCNGLSLELTIYISTFFCDLGQRLQPSFLLFNGVGSTLLYCLSSSWLVSSKQSGSNIINSSIYINASLSLYSWQVARATRLISSSRYLSQQSGITNFFNIASTKSKSSIILITF